MLDVSFITTFGERVLRALDGRLSLASYPERLSSGSSGDVTKSCHRIEIAPDNQAVSGCQPATGIVAPGISAARGRLVMRVQVVVAIQWGTIGHEVGLLPSPRSGPCRAEGRNRCISTRMPVTYFGGIGSGIPVGRHRCSVRPGG